MIQRFDRLPIELPMPRNPSPNEAAAVQELLGGKFGEMSTLMNYTFQSFNFRGRDKLLPIPDVSNKQFPEARAHEEKGLHQILFRFSPEDYREIGKIWNGPHPEDGSELRVEDQIPRGAPPPNLDAEPQLTAPGIEPGLIAEMAKRLFGPAA